MPQNCNFTAMLQYFVTIHHTYAWEYELSILAHAKFVNVVNSNTPLNTADMDYILDQSVLVMSPHTLVYYALPYH